MIKECLLEIANSDLDLGDIRKMHINKYANGFDEEYLSHILSTTGLIVYDIYIHFFIGVGFRCSNDERTTGKLPVCSIIQNILNKKYQEFL